MWDVYVGQKVVCINIDGLDLCIDKITGRIYQKEVELKLGGIYTVSEVVPGGWANPKWWGTDEICIRLEGIVRSGDTMDNVPFRLSRFRPLVKNETMEMLRNIVRNPQNLPEFVD